VVDPSGLKLAGLHCEDGELLIWSLGEDVNPPASPETRDAGAEDVSTRNCAIAFDRSGDLLATGVGNELRLWARNDDAWTVNQRVAVEKHVRALAFSQAGDKLAVGGEFDRILVWRVAEGKLGSERYDSQEPVHPSILALSFEPDGRWLVSGGDDAVAVMWELPVDKDSLKLIKKSQAALHKWKVTALATGRLAGVPALFSADARGQMVLCARDVNESACARVAWPVDSSADPTVDPIIEGLALAADGSDRLLVSQNGLWVWDLSRESLMDTAKRLIPAGAGR
jgi:hypothetical protein